MIRRLVKQAVKKALGIDTPQRATYTNSPEVPQAPNPAPAPVKPVETQQEAESPASNEPAAKKPAAKKPAAKKPAAKKPAAKNTAPKKAPPPVPKKKAPPPVPKKVAPPPAASFTMDDVQEILDDMVRPALQGDGGDITLIRIEDNDIYVRLVGACNTCPSAVMTMKMGVEALLREEFPAMRELIQLDPGIPAG